MRMFLFLTEKTANLSLQSALTQALPACSLLIMQRNSLTLLIKCGQLWDKFIVIHQKAVDKCGFLHRKNMQYKMNIIISCKIKEF